jgi:N-acetylgalactosamine PTS system EIIA component
MSDVARAIVLAHGSLATGLVSAAVAITGDASLFRAMSNDGLDAAGLTAALADAVALGTRVVFTDLPAGSTTMAARRVQKTQPELIVVTGANLPMLLDFAFAAEPPEVAARTAAERGKAGVLVSGGPRAD